MVESTETTDPVTSGDEEIVAAGQVHASVFAPAVAVCVLYGGAWLALAGQGRDQEDFTRLLLLIFAVGTPVLLVHAWLRYRGASVTVTADRVTIARGWPFGAARSVPLGDVVGVEVRRSPFGRLFRTGALTVRLRTGETMTIGDLGQPEPIADALRARLR